MNPETRRVLDILAKYHVLIPVGAIVELGLVPDYDPGITTTLEQMHTIASYQGTVRWAYSGIVERIVPAKNAKGFLAWGFWTRPHFVPAKIAYDCVEDPGPLNAVGNPTLVHPALLRPERSP